MVNFWREALMKALFLLAFLLTAILGSAGFVLNFFKIQTKNSLERLVFSLGLGLGLTAYWVYVLGSVGLLEKKIFIGFFMVLFLFGYKPFLAEAGKVIGDIKAGWQSISFWEKSLLGIVAAVSLLVLCGALAPAIGQDELCYHLTLPKNYIRAHMVYAVPYATNALWPALLHMLFTLGLLLEGVTLAKIFHYLTYLFTFLAVFSFLSRESGRRAAIFGGAVYVLTPVAFIQASFAYIDNGLAFFVFLSFYAFYFFLKEEDARLAAVAGVFTGFAVSVKLIGLFELPILVLLWLPAFIQSKNKKQLIAGLFYFTVFLLIFVSAWYVRAWIERGNPVYPFYPNFFGGHGWSDATYLFHGGARGLKEFFLMPWNLTFYPELFGGEQIGMMYLAILPPLLFTGKKPAWLKSVLFFAAGYTFLWFKVDPNSRFFLPALVFLACAAGFWLDLALANFEGLLKKSIAVLFGAMALVQSAFAVYHFKDAAILLAQNDTSLYLHSKERSYFAAQTINRLLLPSDAILSVGEIRGFYFDNPFVLDAGFYHMSGYAEKVKSGGELAAFLKARGFTYVLDTDLFPGIDLSMPKMSLSRYLREGPDRALYFKETLRIHSKKTCYILYQII